MWLVELLQKTVPHLDSATDRREAIDFARIRDIRVQLLKRAKIRPGEIVRESDEGLVDALCLLRFELDALPVAHELRRDPDSQSAIKAIYAELDRLLGEDVSFDQTQTLDSALERLVNRAGAQSRRREVRKRTVRICSVLVTVIPLLGYGVHWTFGNFYRQALIDDVDIVYPRNKFEYIDGRYRLRESIEEAALQDFREYYFRDTTLLRGMLNPLPLAFHPESALDVGVELPDGVKESLRSAAIILDGIDTNLFMFRVFVRNIRDNNIVNNLAVRAERIDDHAFLWGRMDIDTEIRFESWSGHIGGPPTVEVNTTRTPVLNVSLDMSLLSAGGDIVRILQKNLGMLTSTRWLKSDFAPDLLRVDSKIPVFILLSPARAADTTLDPTHRRTLEEAERDFEHMEPYIAEQGYIFFPCPDGGVAVLARSQTLQQLLALKTVEAIEIEYTYQRLDGVEQSGRQHLALEQPILYLSEGLSARLGELEKCVGGLVYYYGPGELARAAIGPDSLLSGLDKIALMLADITALKAPVIAAKETLLFDFGGGLKKVERGVAGIHILKDGEYVLFTVVATNFRGGGHRFVFYFDEDPVAELTAALQWPQSLRFKAEDVALFRSDAGADAGPQ